LVELVSSTTKDIATMTNQAHESDPRRKAVLYLSSDESENERARELIRKIGHRFAICESYSAVVAFPKKGIPLPALTFETLRGSQGGGGVYGLDDIEVFVELELEDEEENQKIV
jgi:hypothetical protein